MKLIYRISDNSYAKPKLPGTSKASCFLNFTQIFDGIELLVLADNAVESWSIVENHYTIQSSLGNAGSLLWAIEYAISNYEENETVYFCEDDYLHREGSPMLIEEGLSVADYVTLYDHPDKYTSTYDLGEVSKVLRTESSHWRFTVSTCMTFGVKVKTIREDLEVWKKYLDANHPHDHLIFTELNNAGRTLSVCIPGAACHTDLTFSGQANRVLIDEWALDLAAKEIEADLSPAVSELKDHVLKVDMSKWHRLKLLGALASMQ